MVVPLVVTGLDGSTMRSKDSLIHITRLLAGNDKKTRGKALNKLKYWISLRISDGSEFSSKEFMRIWMGLFYSMYMADLPLEQEALADSISTLIHHLKDNVDASILFIKCFTETINKSWGSLDQYRIDKFSMLIRRVLRQSLMWLEKKKWNMTYVGNLMSVYYTGVLSDKAVLGFRLLFIPLFYEELAKAGKGKLPTNVLMAFLHPFVRATALTKVGVARLQLDQFFRNLIRQTDVGIEYNEKFSAWHKAGFPVNDISSVVLDTDTENSMECDQQQDNNDEEQQNLDPRAGSVHVYLPQIVIPVKPIRKLLTQHLNLPEASIKSKRLLRTLSRHFKLLGKGKYPFGIKRIPFEDGNMKKMVSKSAKKMVKEEIKNKKSRLLQKKKRKVLNNKVNHEINGDLTEINNDDVGTKDNNDSVNKNSDLHGKRKRKVIKENTLLDGVTTEKNTKRRKTLFDVSIVDENENNSPVGSKKNSSDSELELDLPCGWIVEPFEKNNQQKRKVMSDIWDVISTNVDGSNNKEVAVKIENTENDVYNSSELYVNEMEQNETPSRKSRRSVRTGLQTDLDDDELLNEAIEIKTEMDYILSEPIANEESEIIVRPKKLTPAFFSKAVKKAGLTPTTHTPQKKMELESSLTKSEKRRIVFNLDRNMSQEKVEYFEQINRSPQIPFDSAKRPKQSALKPNLPRSPINPFYARQYNII